jgi:archaellin
MMLTYSQQDRIPKNFNLTLTDTDASDWLSVIDSDWAADPTGSNGVATDELRIASCTGVKDGGGGATEENDTLISPGNSCSVVLNIGNLGPRSGEWFSIEIKPPIGAPTTIRKTIPTGYNGGKLM